MEEIPVNSGMHFDQCSECGSQRIVFALTPQGAEPACIKCDNVKIQREIARMKREGLLR